MFEYKAIATAKTEAQTEAAPLMPQSNGVKEGTLAVAIFIPKGKAVESLKPRPPGYGHVIFLA